MSSPAVNPEDVGAEEMLAVTFACAVARDVIRSLAPLPREALERLASDVETGDWVARGESGRTVLYVNNIRVCSILAGGPEGPSG